METKSVTIKSELESLMKDKEVTPVRDIEQWARANDKSALHMDLKYDDPEGAADLWRLDRIRRHISVLIVDSNHARETISLSVDRVKGNGYRRTESVLETPDLRSVALRDMIQDYVRLNTKAEELGFIELEPVWQTIDEVQKQLRPKRSRATGVGTGAEVGAVQ